MNESVHGQTVHKSVTLFILGLSWNMHKKGGEDEEYLQSRSGLWEKKMENEDLVELQDLLGRPRRPSFSPLNLVGNLEE